MAREYELIQFEPTDFKVGQNYWCTGAFKGISEPVKIVTPSPEKWTVGQNYYGEVVEAQSKAGKTYLRFKREQRPDQQSFSGTARTEKKEWQPRDDSAIRAQWAIGQSVQWCMAKGLEASDVESTAKTFYAMVDRVKESDVKVSQNDPGKTQTFSNGDPLPGVDQVYEPTDSPVDLSDIPF